MESSGEMRKKREEKKVSENENTEEKEERCSSMISVGQLGKLGRRASKEGRQANILVAQLQWARHHRTQAWKMRITKKKKDKNEFDVQRQTL